MFVLDICIACNLNEYCSISSKLAQMYVSDSKANEVEYCLSERTDLGTGLSICYANRHSSNLTNMCSNNRELYRINRDHSFSKASCDIGSLEYKRDIL